MHLLQFLNSSGGRGVAMIDHPNADLVEIKDVTCVYDLAWTAITSKRTLQNVIADHQLGATLDYDRLLDEKRILPPVDHPEPARFWITGTGLTHIGSADARDQMHELAHGQKREMTDSMKIFQMGLDGGKPAEGEVGVQPEWFYKGVGTCVVAPEADLPLPDFALAGGEEAEIVGLYLIGPNGDPWRIGFTTGNEFSDQETEALNYLYLAHSKLRSCSIGPELLLGELPDDVRGAVRIRRSGNVLWEGEFASGEANMSHSIKNLEHYHFRYDMFRRPGDLHAYFVGAPVLSCANGVVAEPGDRFEIDVPTFGRPLRNTMRSAVKQEFTIRSL